MREAVQLLPDGDDRHLSQKGDAGYLLQFGGPQQFGVVCDVSHPLQERVADSAAELSQRLVEACVLTEREELLIQSSEAFRGVGITEPLLSFAILASRSQPDASDLGPADVALSTVGVDVADVIKRRELEPIVPARVPKHHHTPAGRRYRAGNDSELHEFPLSLVLSS